MYELQEDLDTFLAKKRFDYTLAAEIATAFLSWKGEPLDMTHRLVAMKALHDLYAEASGGTTGKALCKEIQKI